MGFNVLPTLVPYLTSDSAPLGPLEDMSLLGRGRAWSHTLLSVSPLHEEAVKSIQDRSQININKIH